MSAIAPPRSRLARLQHWLLPTEPEHAGFGRRLLERGLARDLDGEARMLFEPDGLRYRLLVPLSDKVSLG